jgi:16S rRNA (uracil1498-N3)-methyltransferase
LADDEIHHLRVRRAKEQDTVQVLDGAGLIGTGTLVRAGGTWMVEMSGIELVQRPTALTLAVAAGDRERFSWMVEKAVELGVTRIVPLETARTAGVATGLKRAHIGRLKRSALESIKQCGVAWAPEIEDILPLLEFLGQPLAGTGWLADQGGDAAPSSMEEESPLSVVVGPEGGLTDEEREAAVMAGYRPLALGRYTLRFETAALAAAVAVNQARMRGHHG